MGDNTFTQSLDRLKESFLWAAAQGGNTQDCESLIEIGADVNWKNHEGDTPLLAACRRGHIDTATILIVHGADVNVVGSDSYSALHICCRRGNYELLSLLLEAHVSTSILTNDGETAMDIAKIRGHTDMYNKLVLYSANCNQDDRASGPSQTAPIRGPDSSSSNLPTSSSSDAPATATTSNSSQRRSNRQPSVLPALPPSSSNITRGAASLAPLTTPVPTALGVGVGVQPKPLPARDASRHRLDPSGSESRSDNFPAPNPSAAATGQSYTLISQSSSGLDDQNTSLRKLFDIEHRERKAAEAKLELMRQQMNRLIGELAEFKTQVETMETDRDALAKRVQLLSGRGLDQLQVHQCEQLERELRATLSAVEDRKNALIQEELANKNDQRSCVVCKEKEKSVLLLPCRHLCLCDACAEHDQLAHCPLCRRAIVHKISVYA